ncbi:MAG: mannose-1-phosphate guanylyltransferase/mannose-6-phosphate isomerase [Arenicellaceae bacterium]|nr:mannose-1-phosphate guanylyltransferase/mannose-6-phosphate isomerase [Arenicellaceae bacterium]
MIPVILSGGSGTRLWPLSRSMYPKQFLPLVTERTMLQETVLRVADVPNIRAPVIVCNEEHRFIVAEQLRAIDVQAKSIILEPVGRNTAPAIALAALKILSEDDDLMLVLPADHVIGDVVAFYAALAMAKQAANSGQLVTFGIVPTQPETGYGYIKAPGGESVNNVQEFVEKPDLATAKTYVDSGDYYWNSGMFMFKASRYLEDLGQTAPDILAACERAVSSTTDDIDFTRVDKEAFESSPDDSIDYAVMEKTKDAGLVPLSAQWSDVGSWSSLWGLLLKDANGNTTRGDVLTEDSTGCYVHADTKLVTTLGLQDIVVVETDDAVLVAAKNRVQNVKEIVNNLKQNNRPETELHRKVYRPWGTFDSIDSGEKFQVKRIVVNPGAKLSLQMHHYRAEHWVVVSGTAEVTNGENTFMLKENESTFIPIGKKHSLANSGTEPLEIIEVQSGSYLGEDDIIRFEDVYGRAE